MNGLVWFRRDLRVNDHFALSRALQTCQRVWCVFVFDTEILDALPSRSDRRVEFIQGALEELHASLRKLSPLGHLIVLHGPARAAIPWLAQQLQCQTVFSNRDFEPSAIDRDQAVERALKSAGIGLEQPLDHVIFAPQALRTAAGGGYTVFSPYRNAWLKHLTASHLTPHPVHLYAAALAPWPTELTATPENLRGPWSGPPALETIGFEPTNLRALGIQPGEAAAQGLFESFVQRIGDYRRHRDFPAIRGPSYLSVHLRFGTISIRQLVQTALQIQQTDAVASDGATSWLAELIWRDFYVQILANWPHVAQSAFKPDYDRIQFADDEAAEERFLAWTEGRTGYPLVDAAIAQIRHSGWMHNRLRMVTASFLIKDLGIHWNRGERWFADQLLDFDLSANNGGWQWASSSGCDAQPYFRIFNPVTQSEKFDPDGRFIRRYLPQLASLPNKALHAPWLASSETLRAAGVELGATYPHPIVDHALARLTTLERYAVVRSRTESE
jgi:deoxyribodipyrimidine photo-lyase